MDLKTLVSAEIDRIKIPKQYKVDIRPYSDVCPHDPPQSSHFIQLSIGSPKEDPTHDTTCSYLDFWYNQDEMRIEGVNFSLKERLRGKGLGRKLVSAMERIGESLSCNSVRINLNTNPSFWEYMGYQKIGDYWEKSLPKEKRYVSLD